MGAFAEHSVTRLLEAMRAGDRPAADRLFALVYDELHGLAVRQRGRWRGDATLNATALVHEVYLKLVGGEPLELRSRGHFFALAGRAMRQILGNYARARRAQKRGGGAERVSLEAADAALLDGSAVLDDERLALFAELEAALQRLERLSERQARVVECRFFAGLSIPETAQALETSPATVKRDWTLAQAWLYRELRRARDEAGS